MCAVALFFQVEDAPQSLLQIQRSPLIPARAKVAIESFLAVSEYHEEEGPPKANAYEACKIGGNGVSHMLVQKLLIISAI